jgi:hypothetical protein
MAVAVVAVATNWRRFNDGFMRKLPVVVIRFAIGVNREAGTDAANRA